jgi:hypothetical protein
MGDTDHDTPSEAIIHSENTQTENTVQSEDNKKGFAVVPNIVETEKKTTPDLPQSSQDATWQPGVVKRAPWLAITALVSVMLCVAACATILLISNDQPTAHWKVQPTVWLALLSAVINALLAFALGIGVSITWWRKALSGGTLNDLHRYWQFGDSLWAAVTSWKNVNIIALATISVTLAALDGPFLQRASSVISRVNEEPVNVSVQISTELPYGFTGLHTEFGGDVSLLKYPFTQVMLSYSNRVPLTANTSKCDGFCTATVRAAGLSLECATETRPIDFGATAFGANETILPTAYDKHLVFYTNFTFKGGETSTIAMTNIYSNTAQNGPKSCPGQLTIKNCTLQPALVEYSIRIENSGPRAQILLNTTADPRVVSLTTYPDVEFQSSTFGGIYLAAQQIFASQAFLTFEPNREWNFASSGSLANRYLHLDQYSSSSIFLNCNLTFGDPTSDIFLALNEIMFRTALVAANATDIQNVQAMQTSTKVVFKTQYQYLLGAVAIILFSVATSSLMLNGWWILGRKTSLSPVEIAKAFNAPFLHSIRSSNASVEDLLKEIGEREVKYGEVRFRIEDGAVVSMGEIDPATDQQLGRRLEMADPQMVQSPLVVAQHS